MHTIMDFSWVSTPAAWIGLLSLIALEVVLGIDNIVFISILSGRLPLKDQARARQVGLVLAVIPRILLLLALGWVLRLKDPLFTLPFPDPGHAGHNLGLSGQDLIVLVGGIFLIAKATTEIHHKLEGEDHSESEANGAPSKASSFSAVMTQIVLLNIVFSLDSIITAIGMVSEVAIMIIAVLVSTVIMAFTVNPVSRFVNEHPTFKMLALSFLLLIGMTLMIEGLHFHIPKGYVYFAMGFSVFVEVLNLRLHKRGKKPVKLVDSELPSETHSAPGTPATAG